MFVHVKDFVQGDIKYREIKGKHFVEDADNIMELKVGDNIIWANKTHCQPWLQSGHIKKFGSSGQPERVEIDECISINLEGECYIGLLYSEID